jgi:transposase
MAKRRKYSKEFKEDCVRFLLAHPEKMLNDSSKELGVERSILSRWRKEFEESQQSGLTAFPGNGNPRDEENYRLRRENAELREELEILKKAVAILSRTKR